MLDRDINDDNVNHSRNFQSSLFYYAPVDRDFSDDKKSRLIDTKSFLIQYASADIEPWNGKPKAKSSLIHYAPADRDNLVMTRRVV